MADLKELERAMDEATLAFWQAIENREMAKRNFVFVEDAYDLADRNMRTAKAAYLRAKLGIE